MDFNENEYNKKKSNKKSSKHDIKNKNDVLENYSMNSYERKHISSIKTRMDTIKNLLDNSNLEQINPLKNMDTSLDTDFFEGNNNTNNKHENKSCDTRIILGKKNQDFYKVIEKLNSKLEYIKSGAYGNTFKGIVYDKNGEETTCYGFKVVAYARGRGSIHDVNRPENAEINMLRLLSYFVIKNYTPHVVLPIGIFNTSIEPFVEEIGENIKKNEKYAAFLRNYEKGAYHNKVSVIMSEWANRGDLGMFLKKHYESLELIHWKCLFFQIISTLAKIQLKYPKFRHNDLKANNVLVSKVKNDNIISLYYIEGKVYNVPGIGYFLYLWDFDFACIPGVVENNKVYEEWTQKMNITSNQNRYYDLHYFFCTLVYKGFLPNLFKSKLVPSKVKEFIKYVIPKQYRPHKENKNVNEKCRLQVDVEHILPIDLLEHEFFNEFKKQ
jgi:hypothetical protein